MSLTAYQTVVRSHLCDIFSKDLLYSDDVVLFIENDVFRNWVIQLSLDHGYIPVFSYSFKSATGKGDNKHVIVSFIKKFIPC